MRHQTDPVDRDPFIDALRVTSVLVVVFGHWLTTTVIWEDGLIDIENALSVVRGSHVVTWLIQVMPLLFFVGGFANARSLEAHGGDYLAFLRTRYVRLLTPTLVFVAVWLGLGLLEGLLGLDRPNPLDRAADQAALPFWFLGLYVIVVALAPPMLALHRRHEWRVLVSMVAGVVAVDVLHHGLGVPHIGVLNYAFVWLLAHQLGYFYADGRLQNVGRRATLAIAAAGLAGLVVLTTAVGYPVSMVGVPGDDRWNTNPPSLALVMLTVWLVGLALWLRSTPPSPGSWLISRIERGNRVVLTVFLWHVTAISLTAAIIYPLGSPRFETGTWQWWALRPVWMVVLVPAMLGLVVGFRRFEVHPKPARLCLSGLSTTRRLVAGLGVVSLALGILGFGVTGFNRITETLGEEVLGFEMNPLQNVLHLALGIIALVSVPRTPGLVRAAATLIVGVYALIGLAGSSSGIRLLGANPASSVLHLVVGAVAGVLLCWATLVDYRIDRRATAAEPLSIEDSRDRGLEAE